MPLYGHFCSFFSFFPNIFDVCLWLGVDQHWSTFIDILLLNVWYRSSAGSANTGNEPAFSFCTLVKFTSHFIQRKLYSTVTHTYTRRCTGPTSFFYDSAKKIALKKKKRNQHKCADCALFGQRRLFRRQQKKPESQTQQSLNAEDKFFTI